MIEKGKPHELAPLFAPSSVAVIGASNRPERPGFQPKIKYAYLKYGARRTKSFSGVGYDDTIEKNDDILNELDINMRFTQESGNFDLDKLSW